MGCRYCDGGYEVRNGEHWIVKSIRRPTIQIVACKNVRQGCVDCGMGPCRFGDPRTCAVPKTCEVGS